MKNILLGSTAFAMVLAVAAPQQAHAQTAAPQAAPAQVEEVVITAQKRKENLSKATVTADVVSSTALTQMSVTDISDLNKVVPAVSLNASTNGRTPYAMRGVSTTANEGNVGLESGVEIELDGIPVPSDSHAAQQIQDIESIQVLEGPQSTLGGRAAAAGLIDMITRAPKSIWSGEANFAITTDGEKRGDVFITGPLAPSWNFSVAGYGNQTPYPITNIHDNEKTTQGAAGARVKLQYKPDALLTATLTAHYDQSESYGDNFAYTYITPGATLLGVPLPQFTGGHTPDFSPAALMSGITINDRNLSNNSIVNDAGAHIVDRDVSLNASYQLGNLTLGSITGYQSETERDIQDLFDNDEYFFNVLTGGNLNFDNNQVALSSIRQISQEFKLASPVDDPINYVVGLYGSNLDIHAETHRNGLPPATDDIASNPETSTYDAYGRVTEILDPQFSLTEGLRFNDDDLKVTQTQYMVGAAPYSAGNPTGSPWYVQATSHNNSGALVGDFTAKYNINSRDMAYATYARGYAPGAYNTATALSGTTNGTPGALASTDIASPVHRMDINHFEIGSKGRYMDGRLVLNADLFYTIYDNYQVETFSSTAGLVNPPLVLASAPEAQTHGVEANGTYRPAVNTTITASAAYIDATYVKYPDAECWFVAGGGGNAVAQAGSDCYFKPGTNENTLVQNVNGKTLPNSPKYKFVINAEQRFPIDQIGADLVADAVYSWRSSAQMLADQNPYAVQKSFGLLNLSAGLQSQNGRYSATIYVNNVLNKIYYTDVEDFWNGPWGGGNANRITAVISQPGRDAHRFAGLRLSAKF